MRDEHPIDNRFREALFSAEVQPPPGVWEGVKNKRRRRGMAFWSRRRGLTIVTLFVALGAGAYWALHADRATTYEADQAEPSVATHGTSPLVPSIVETTPVPPSTGTAVPRTTTAPVSSIGPVELIAGEDPPSRAPAMAANDDATSIASENPQASSRSSAEAATGAVARAGGEPSATPTPGLDAGPVRRMDALHTRWQGKAPGPAPQAAIVPVYVLPKSDWWLGVQMGWYDVHRQWSGGSAQLRDALNASEAWTSTIGVGVSLGRTWRSGWGFSLGAEHERSEQQFQYVDRSVELDETIETILVTLDTEVFLFDADTIVTQVVNEHIAEGIDRRSVLRIPVEGHWRGSWHRWMYGLGVGVAGEFTHTTSSSILVEDADGGSTAPADTTGNSIPVEDADGRIVSAAPEGSELRDRYPTVLLGSVSADVGYLLHERWALWVSPTYMRSITTFGNGSDVVAEPERFGVRLRLSYTFNCPR